ncbi:unnamed protein product [Macrosiphum euphorbiae]|uniref:Uncharacterized protein n=1 Tax=Macrosiphum euphorbiae TaxID=13131 RepID=A0AAV0Y4T6_9HEMI|nr:unnamed protein product [Macrosiphum euphorbiae]
MPGEKSRDKRSNFDSKDKYFLGVFRNVMDTILMAIDLRYTEKKNENVLIGLPLICPGPIYFENIHYRVETFGKKLEVFALMSNVEVTEVLEELIAFATSYKTMIPL